MLQSVAASCFSAIRLDGSGCNVALAGVAAGLALAAYEMCETA